MKKILAIAMITAVAFFAVGCGSSGTTSSDTPTITDLSSMPKATSPMASSSSANVAAAAKAAVKSFEKAAATGLVIATTTSSNFDATDSLGGCNTFNSVKQSISSATQADMILCYVDQMNTANQFATDESGNALDIYDGEYHVFNLNIVGSSGGPDRVKLKIVKDSAGSITSFEMFMCKRNVTTGALFQNEYVNQVLDGAAYTMVAKGSYEDSQGSGSHYVDVIGRLDSAGKYLTKVITVKNTGSWGGGSNWGEGEFTQVPGAFEYEGYQKGGFSQGGHSGTFEDKAHSFGQMIGDATAFTSLAMGDGAGQFGQSGSFDDQSYTPDVLVNSWDGDTVATVASNDYTASATASTLPAAAAQPTISFDSAQTWTDCAGDTVTLNPIADSTLSAACADYGNMQGGNWIQCYNIMGQQPQ